MTQDNDTNKAALKFGEEPLTQEQISEQLRADNDRLQRLAHQLGQQVLRERERANDLEHQIDEKATEDAEHAEQNETMLTILLDNVSQAIGSRLRQLQANGVTESNKAHEGIMCDLLGGVYQGSPGDLYRLHEFIVRGIARRRASGVPGTNAVGL